MASNSLLSGVEEHGMLDIGNRREPGRAYEISKGSRVCRTRDNKPRKTKVSRQSDNGVVPKKAGNAAGGKAVTLETVLKRNTYRAQ
jgi:hypothetical protein